VKGINEALSSKVKGEVINVGSGKKETLESVAKIIIKETKSKSKIILNDEYKRAKDSACWADISKAKQLLNWEPKYSIAKGIEETVKWLANNQNTSSAPNEQ